MRSATPSNGCPSIANFIIAFTGRPAGRPRILRFGNNLRNVMDRYLRMSLGVLQNFEVAHREHRMILAAYRQGNALLAVKRVETHLRKTADGVVAFLTVQRR